MAKRWPNGLRSFVKKHGIRTKTIGKEKHLLFYKAVYGPLYKPWSIRHRPHGKKAPYKPGTLVRVRVMDEHRAVSCGAGLHVAPLKNAVGWVVNRSKGTWSGRADRIVEVAVRPGDIVVPLNQLGGQKIKIRCRQLLVLRKVPRSEWPLIVGRD